MTRLSVRLLKKWEGYGNEHYQADSYYSVDISDHSRHTFLGYGLFPMNTQIRNYESFERFKEVCKEKGVHVVFLEDLEEESEEEKEEEKDWEKRHRRINREFEKIEKDDILSELIYLEEKIESIEQRLDEIVSTHELY